MTGEAEPLPGPALPLTSYIVDSFMAGDTGAYAGGAVAVRDPRALGVAVTGFLGVASIEMLLRLARDIPVDITAARPIPAPTPENDQLIYRFGPGPETIGDLTARAAQAEAKIGIHGISASTKPHATIPSRSARMSDVRMAFPVIKTLGPGHYTIVLPKPVTGNVVDTLNLLFK